MESGHVTQSFPRRIVDPSRSIAWTGDGRSDDFGQKILAERGGAKRLPASRRVGKCAAGTQDTAQLSFPAAAAAASFNKELHLSRGSEEQSMELSLKAFLQSFTCL